MINNDPVLAGIYNKKILAELKERFGSFQEHHVDLKVASAAMRDLLQKWVAKDRRGEVVMVVPTPEGRVWLHTKEFYPEGLYRLMSGGLDPEEDPINSMQRELVEETGFKAKIDRCLAVITYTVSDNELTVPFVSYIFLTKSVSARPESIDPHEAISDFKAVTMSGLADATHQLRHVTGHFAEWGTFRAIAHELVLERWYLVSGRN